MRHIGWGEVYAFCRLVAGGKAYGVGVGGKVLAGIAQQNCETDVIVVDDIESADFVMMSVLEEGSASAERAKYGLPIVAMIDKNQESMEDNSCVDFPWDDDRVEGPPVQSVIDQLTYLDEDPNRLELLDTPARYLKAMRELTSGYREDPVKQLGTLFKAEGRRGQTIVVKRIEFNSLCEHHMLPFNGSVDLAYMPDEQIVGLSKVARLVRVFSRRFQVQERLAFSIAQTFDEVVKPLGLLVVVRGRHSCMSSRGIECQNGSMVVMETRGLIEQDPTRRSDALKLLEMK